jgi:hypothetical protein
VTFQLLTVGNTKTIKGQVKGYQTYILHLLPDNLAGFGSVCPKSTEGCRTSCLNTAGHGGMFKPGGTNTVQEARRRRTTLFFQDRAQFMHLLHQDVTRAIKQAHKATMTPVFRLNGTSDLPWEKYRIPEQNNRNIFECFADVQFYDYTKIIHRKVSNYTNYHLTFSQSETNDTDVEWAVAQGLNVAVVFDHLPETYKGLTVIDGDEDDLRFLDPRPVIIGLRAKGRARKDTTGFVVRNSLALAA